MINLMFKVKNNTIPEALEHRFEIAQLHYPTMYGENNFIERKIYFKATKLSISSRGPCLWNNLTDRDTKTITSTLLFKRKLKNHLIKVQTTFRNFIRYRTIPSLNSLSDNFQRMVGHSLKILCNAARFLRCVSLFWSIMW